MEIDDSDLRNLENELVAADGLGEAMELAPAMMALRATKMFTEGIGAPRQSKEPALASEPTFWIAKLAKEVVSELFDHRRDEVLESWGCELDREEALGYLIADAVGKKISPTDARNVGKKASKALKAKKEEDDKLKGKERAKKSKARKAAANDTQRAAALPARLAELDSNCLAARAELWGAHLELPIPARPAPAGKSAASAPASPPPKEDPVRVAKEAVARSETLLAEARQAEAQAELAAIKAKRELEKLWLPGQKTTYVRGDASYDFAAYLATPLHARPPETAEESEERYELYRAQQAKEDALCDSLRELSKAGAKVVLEELDLDWKARILKTELAHERRLAELARVEAAEEAEARAAEVQRSANFLADMAEERAKWKAKMDQEERAMKQRLDEDIARVQWAKSRPRVVSQHAEQVWGQGWDKEDRPAPKVFSLVGKSASEVRGMAGQVCQEGTGVEEQVALNRKMRMPLMD